MCDTLIAQVGNIVPPPDHKISAQISSSRTLTGAGKCVWVGSAGEALCPALRLLRAFQLGEYLESRHQLQEATPLAQKSPAIAPPINEPRYNERIRAREVRLVDADGSQVGVVSIVEALERAAKAELDLVEVAAQADPPVCRIMDYGKFRYEEAQRIKESRKKTIQITMKEVKFKPKIGKGDFNTKVRHIHEFLEEGHKVKVTLQFRGREMAHPELGTKILDAVIEDLGQLARVDTMARLEGRNMTMVLSPEKKAAAKKPSTKPAAPATTTTAPVATSTPVATTAPVEEAPVPAAE